MFRIISALLVLFLSLPLVGNAADAPLELAADAPSRHVVVPGDTLWGISAKFLKDPYRWNELWKLNNDEVKNPQRIYPGQVLVLDTSTGEPRLSIQGGGVPTVKLEPQVLITDLSEGISAIPQQVIEPFLSQPLVAETDDMGTAPRIVAVDRDTVIAGAGDLVYVTGIKSGSGRAWQIYRPGQAMKDPASGKVLGYEAVFLGTARLVQDGEPATVRISMSNQEIGKDDRLVPAPRLEIVDYPLHRPTKAIDSRVVSIYGQGTAGGVLSIIAIAGGSKSGIEVGHVLALSKSGVVATDRYEGRKRDVTLPDLRYGLIYVFRTFQNVSYALVMKSEFVVAVGDAVGTP